jgi:hypothetical protein
VADGFDQDSLLWRHRGLNGSKQSGERIERSGIPTGHDTVEEG